VAPFGDAVFSAKLQELSDDMPLTETKKCTQIKLHSLYIHWAGVFIQTMKLY